MRRARVDAGLTISELAKRAGVSRDTISHAEKGQHSPQGPTLSKIAYALGRAPSELLAEEERLLPKAESRSSLEPSFSDALEDEWRETAARGAALERYESLRDRLANIEELGRHEQRAVFDESLQLFKDLLLSDLDDVLTDSERREQSLVLDVLQQATWHILALWELGQERGELGENVIDLEEARAAKARLKAAG